MIQDQGGWWGQREVKKAADHDGAVRKSGSRIWFRAHAFKRRSHVTRGSGRASFSETPMNPMHPESDGGRVPRRSFLLSALFLCPQVRLLRAAQDTTFSTD